MGGPAGCGLMGSAKNKPETDSVRGRTEPLNEHQLGDDAEAPLCVVDQPHGMAERPENVRRVADWCG
jgi:hypothetical protein